MGQKIDQISDDLLEVISYMRSIRQYQGAQHLKCEVKMTQNLERLELILLMIKQINQIDHMHLSELNKNH